MTVTQYLLAGKAHMLSGDRCWKRQYFEAWPSLSSLSTLWLDSSGSLWPALPGHLLPHVSRADRCWRQQRPDSFQQLLRSSAHTHALSYTPPQLTDVATPPDQLYGARAVLTLNICPEGIALFGQGLQCCTAWCNRTRTTRTGRQRGTACPNI